MTLILSNDDVEKLLTMPDCVEALEQAYKELAFDRGITRQRSDCITPTSHAPDAVYGLKSMDGVVPALGVGAIRINSDLQVDHLKQASQGRGRPIRHASVTPSRRATTRHLESSRHAHLRANARGGVARS
jgi:hypothetical protein